MKIVVAGGRDEADFLIGLLLMGKHKLITVNEDMSYCEHLAAVHDDISVIYGDPCKEYVMEDAGIRGCDIVIALREKDADNLEICQMAKMCIRDRICWEEDADICREESAYSYSPVEKCGRSRKQRLLLSFPGKAVFPACNFFLFVVYLKNFINQ